MPLSSNSTNHKDFIDSRTGKRNRVIISMRFQSETIVKSSFRGIIKFESLTNEKESIWTFLAQPGFFCSWNVANASDATLTIGKPTWCFLTNPQLKTIKIDIYNNVCFFASSSDFLERQWKRLNRTGCRWGWGWRQLGAWRRFVGPHMTQWTIKYVLLYSML